LENHKTYQESFELKDENMEISFEMVEIIPENLLKNPFFEDWEVGELLNWKTSAQVSQAEPDKNLTGNYALQFKHGFQGPYDDDQSFTHNEADGQEVTYYGEIWVKGYGDVRIGIRPPGTSWHSVRYSDDWSTINTDKWKKITFKRTDIIDNSDGEFRIRHRQSSGKDDTNLLIGAAWLSDQKPPADWPR